MVDNHQKATQPQRDHIFRNCIYRFNNFSLSLSKFRALRNLYIIKKHILCVFVVLQILILRTQIVKNDATDTYEYFHKSPFALFCVIYYINKIKNTKNMIDKHGLKKIDN